MCVLYLEKNNTFGDTGREEWKRALTPESRRTSRLARVKRAKKFRERHRCKRKNKSRQKIFLFFRCHVSQNRGQTLGEKVSVVSPREKTTLERESARAFYITLYIFVEKRETEDKER